MTEAKVEYIAMVNIMTEPVWWAGTEPTPEQLAQIKNIRDYIYLGQIQTKTAVKKSLVREVKHGGNG